MSTYGDLPEENGLLVSHLLKVIGTSVDQPGTHKCLLVVHGNHFPEEQQFWSKSANFSIPVFSAPAGIF